MREEALELLEEAELRAEYVELLPHLRYLSASLVARIERAVGTDADVQYRIKSWDAVREKLARSAAAHVADLTDLVGVRVVVSSAEAVDTTSETLAVLFNIHTERTTHLALGLSAAHLIIRGGAPIGRRLWAEVQIVTRAEEARRALEHDRLFKQPLQVQRPLSTTNAVAGHEATLATFCSLLDRSDVHEKRDVHPFLKENSFILYPNPDAVMSEVPIGLGTEYRIDFVIQQPEGTYVLVEIESPRAPILTSSGDFSAKLNHAICQVEDWQEWIEANLPTVDRHYPGIRSPEAWVVIGRDSVENPAVRRRITRRNINMRGHVTLKTYDDLLRGARSYMRSLARALAG